MIFKPPKQASAFPEWSDRIEQRMKRAVWLLVAALLISQSALQIPAVRSWLIPTEKWEGVPFQRNNP